MQATSVALDHLLRAVGDPVADLRDIGPGHREFASAQILRAAVGVLAKGPEGLAAVDAAVRAADRSALSPRHGVHLAAAEAWLAGDPMLAAERYAAILARWPRDLLALRLAQSCYFFLGWHERLCALVDAAIPAWSHDEYELGYVLAMASFAHAESGDAATAEALGRIALHRDPACPYGVHAVAHAIAESGRAREGARWMREQRAHWAGESRMRTHNAWHLAMFDAEDGDAASALGILDEWLLPASEHSPLDACDAAALLGRLAAEGIGARARWRRVSDAFEQSVTPGFWPFVDLHAALAHLAAGQHRRLWRLAQSLERRAQGGDYAATRARQITLPGMVALIAGRRPVLAGAGGSRIQLEVLASIGARASSTEEHLPWTRQAATKDRVFAERWHSR